MKANPSHGRSDAPQQSCPAVILSFVLLTQMLMAQQNETIMTTLPTIVLSEYRPYPHNEGEPVCVWECPCVRCLQPRDGLQSITTKALREWNAYQLEFHPVVKCHVCKPKHLQSNCWFPALCNPREITYLLCLLFLAKDNEMQSLTLKWTSWCNSRMR